MASEQTERIAVRYFTSDWHFGHRVCSLARGFGSDTDSHDHAIVAAHNLAVRHDDDVTYFLGDMTLGKPSLAWSLVDAMKGRKIAVVGNHDAPFPAHRDALRHQAEWRGHFDAVVERARVNLAGEEVLMSHLPYLGGGDHTPGPERYTQWRYRDEGRF